MGVANAVCNQCENGLHSQCNVKAWDYDADDVTECRCWRGQHKRVVTP